MAGFGSRVIDGDLADYVGISQKQIARKPLFQRTPDSYLQLVLVHRTDRWQNIVLQETPVSIFAVDGSIEERARADQERLCAALNVPMIARDVSKRDPRNIAVRCKPDDAFRFRFPDELNMSVRDLAKKGRIEIDAKVSTPPREITIEKTPTSTTLRFKYSAVLEWSKIAGLVLGVILVFSIPNRPIHGVSLGDLILPLIFFGVPVLCALVTVAGLLVFQNGSELILSDETWTERQGTGLMIFPSYMGEARIAVSAIEAIRCKGWKVIVETDAHIHQIRCGTRRGARWMRLALLSAAVYGPNLHIDVAGAGAEDDHGGGRPA